MTTEITDKLQAFCDANEIKRLEADDIRELLADGEDPAWVAEQATEDRPEAREALTALLTEMAPQLAPETSEEDEGADDEGIVLEAAPDDTLDAEGAGAEALDAGDMQAQLAALGEALPPGVDAKQLEEMLSSPRGQLMADFGAYCQEQGMEGQDEEQLRVAHDEWLQTPRDTLEGKKPADLLEGGRLLPEKVVTFRREQPKVGRNDPCPCGSGKKYKKCCGKGG